MPKKSYKPAVKAEGDSKINLFDDFTVEDGLNINSEFASKFEKKKKLEDLNNLKLTYGDIPTKKLVKFDTLREKDDLDESDMLSSDSEDELEDEDGDLYTPVIDAQILKTIATFHVGKQESYDATKNLFS
ncbi:hypothetical protein HK096_010752, partial [Nowakowskiella sp. JEL0078]